MKSTTLVKLRGITSLLLLGIIIIQFFTGIGLYLAPSGHISNETGWTFFSLTKDKLEKLHTVVGFLMGAVVILHITLNWKMLKNELKILFRRK